MKSDPTSLCMWCEEYHRKTMWCDSFGHAVLEPWKPRRCNRYDGVMVNTITLSSLKEVLKEKP